jgi:hypothetical protein
MLIALALLNTWTTRAVLHDDLSSRGQRAAQIAIVWLVPLLGALLTLYLKREKIEPSTGRYREEPDPGDDFAFSAQGFRRTKETLETDGSISGDGVASD